MSKRLSSEKQLAFNATMLGIFHIAKIVFPFIVLPYLTHVLSTTTYGVVTYVKTIMSYLQILVDFGFMLSATKDIVKTANDKKKLGLVVGETLLARCILGLFGFVIVVVLCMLLPLLRENITYTILSYLAIFSSIFLMDFLFRGINQMQVITTRFIIMKSISTFFTFLVVKTDQDILMIPLLELLSSLVAVFLVFLKIKKLSIHIRFNSLSVALHNIQRSSIYFLSNIASTSLNAVSTILIGVALTATDVAYWGICMQIIGTIQGCYTPLSDSLYPEMVRTKNIKLVHKTAVLFSPIISIGCVTLFFLARPIIVILGGNNYIDAIVILQLLIPCLFSGFFAIIYGWPTLGSIDKNKEVSLSTAAATIFNVIGLAILLLTKNFNLAHIAILRSVTELVLFAIRFFAFYTNRHLFNRVGRTDD